jgi:hypothetical protein
MQGGKKLDFAERDESRPVLLGLSLAGNLVKPPLSLYGTEWRERGYGLSLCPELEVLDVLGTKVLRVFLIAIHSHLYLRILLPPTSP